MKKLTKLLNNRSKNNVRFVIPVILCFITFSKLIRRTVLVRLLITFYESNCMRLCSLSFKFNTDFFNI